MFDPIAINPHVNVRDTKWIQVCPNCQHERFISYCQAFNIKTNKANKECKKCIRDLGLGKVNITGLQKGRTAEIQKKSALARVGLKRGKSKQLQFRQIFAPETLSNPEMRSKQSLAKKGKFGDLCNNWRGGTTKDRQLAMGRPEYKNWRISVFTRDNFCCVICLSNKDIQADHIKEWCNYPELRYEVSNGRTLCKSCHKLTDNYGPKARRK